MGAWKTSISPRPSGAKLAGLAKVLEVTVDYLLGTEAGENLVAAEDKAFFASTSRCTPDTKAKLRRMMKLLDE